MGCRHSLWGASSRGYTFSRRRRVLFFFFFAVNLPTVSPKLAQNSASNRPSITFHDHAPCSSSNAFNASGNPQTSTIHSIHRALGRCKHGTNLSKFRRDRIIPRHPSLLQPRPNLLREPKAFDPRRHVYSGPLLGLSLASTHPFNSAAPTPSYADESAESHTQAPLQPVSARNNHIFLPFLSWFCRPVRSLLDGWHSSRPVRYKAPTRVFSRAHTPQ